MPSVDNSETLWQRAHRVLAAGLWTVSQGAFRYPEGTFPMLASHGDGCRLFDVEGRPYVDWMMGWGPVVLGYRHPTVEEAIRRQLAAGPLLSLLHPIEIEVAEAIREAVPCAERVAFGKNGSDVLAMAVRVARAATGREGVLVHGYHGIHDWYMASVPSCEGIPQSQRYLVRSFPYNDLGAVQDLFGRFGDRIAAIVLEPMNVTLPAPGFLEGLRELTLEHGALLIFDEIITGFRLARGGAQEAFGVIPDLACVGKGLANGMPLSALVGKRDVMEVLERVGYGLTYRGETLSLAAAKACLEIYATEPVFEKLAGIGSSVRTAFDAATRARGIEAGWFGPPCRMSLDFAPRGGITSHGLKTLFVQECLKRGVLTNGNLLASAAHDAAAVTQTVEAFEGALDRVDEAIARRSLSGLLHMPALEIFYEDRALCDHAQVEGLAC